MEGRDNDSSETGFLTKMLCKLKETKVKQGFVKNILRFHNVPERIGENLKIVLIQFLFKQLRIFVNVKYIQQCYRIITPSRKRPRPICVKFTADWVTTLILRRRFYLRPKYRIVEELCFDRAKVLKAACVYFGKKNVHVVDGAVEVKLRNGRHINFFCELQFHNFIDLIRQK